MKGLKRVYLTAVMAVTLTVTGCGTDSDQMSGDTILSDGQEESGQTDSQNEEVVLSEDQGSETPQAQEDETSSFVFSMSTSYMEGSEQYTGGYIKSGTMRTGDKAVLVKSNGISFEAKIERLALSQDDGDSLPVSEAEEGSSMVYVWLEGDTSYDWREWPSELLWMSPDELQTGDSLLGTKEWEQGIPVDFPFEESEEYTLTFAPQEQSFAVKEQEKRQGEFRLYNRDGAVVQRIPYGKYQLPFSSYVFCRNDRSNLLFFPDEESNVGRVIEWHDGRFTEGETDKKWKGHLLTEETDTELIEERYGFQGDGITLERKRSFTLRKDTGELRIWDDIAGECLLETTAELDQDGNPVNQDYYNFLFRNAPYDQSDDYDPKVHMDLEYENEEWHEVSYESKEAFLEEYGVENSTPGYQSCDRYGNPRLELYEDQSGEQFCGIIYRKYYVTGKKEKWAKMYGFTISKEKTEKEKWSDNTYSIMSKIGPDDEKGYEETIEYTEDEKPLHFESRGLAEVNNGSGIEEELIPLMEVDYIYRDDGTLFCRDYGHNTYLYATNDSSLISYYDKKERVVYEDGYITSGDQEYYYVYEDDGNIPICKLDVRYIHGGISVYPTWYY